MHEFSHAVFADGALPEMTKQLIAVAVAHTTQCPYCIQGHTRLAARKGASPQQIMEAIWVAAEMRAGRRVRALHTRAARARHSALVTDCLTFGSGPTADVRDAWPRGRSVND